MNIHSIYVHFIKHTFNKHTHSTNIVYHQKPTIFLLLPTLRIINNNHCAIWFSNMTSIETKSVLEPILSVGLNVCIIFSNIKELKSLNLHYNRENQKN